jgi:predicted nucleotidyltransferase
MRTEEIRNLKAQINRLAAKYGIKQVYLFGSVARGQNTDISDVDFLIELDEEASLFGVGGFQYEMQKLLGIEIDVIPTFVLPLIDDQDFAQTIQTEAILL